MLSFQARLTFSIFEEDFDRIERLVVLDFAELFQSQDLLATPQPMRYLVPAVWLPVMGGFPVFKRGTHDTHVIRTKIDVQRFADLAGGFAQSSLNRKNDKDGFAQLLSIRNRTSIR